MADTGRSKSRKRVHEDHVEDDVTDAKRKRRESKESAAAQPEDEVMAEASAEEPEEEADEVSGDEGGPKMNAEAFARASARDAADKIESTRKLAQQLEEDGDFSDEEGRRQRKKQKKPARVEEDDEEEGQMDYGTQLEGGGDPKAETYGPNDPAAGIVEHIRLDNFMCHQCLEVAFGPRINFVCGENGSGKSAILTALSLGLGGSARSTNRATSMKGLVRAPAPYALITIHLRNRGHNAYRFDVYGPTIIIERRINREAGGGWKVKDHKGKVRCTAKKEVERIIEMLSIAVDNPMVLLNQDTSRAFLTQADPKQKYKFYALGTRIQQILEEYMQIKSEKDTLTQIILEKKARSLPQMKKEYDAKKELFDAVQQVYELQEKLKNLKAEFAWALVIEKETALEDANRDFEKLKEDVDKLEPEIDRARKEKAELEVELQRLTGDSGAVLSRIRDITMQLKELQKKHTSEKVTANAKAEEKKERLKEMKKQVKHREVLEAEVKRIKDRNETDIRREHEAHQRKLRDAQGVVHDLDRELAEHRDGVEALREKRKGMDDEINRAKAENSAIVKRYKDLDVERKRVSKATNNLGNFGGEGVVRLVAAIERGHRFRAPVLGPIGVLLRVRNKNLVRQIQNVLKWSPTAWVVQNNDDEKELRRMAVDVGLRDFNIFVQAAATTVYNIRQESLPDPRLTTVLSQLECDHPIVLNALIDHQSIEKHIVFERDDDAKDVMYAGTGPRNVYAAWTAAYQYENRNGSLARSHTGADHHRLTLGVSVAEQLANIDTTMADLLERGKASQQAVKDQEAAATNVTNEGKQLQRAHDLCRSKLNKAREHLAEVEGEHVDDLEEDPTSVIEEIEKVARIIEDLNEEADSLQMQADKLQANLQPIIDSMQTLKDEERRIRDETNESNRKADTQGEAIKAKDLEIKKLVGRRDTSGGYLKKAGDKVQFAKSELESSLGVALKLSEERIHTDKDVGKLKKQIEIDQRNVNKHVEKQGDPEVIRDEFLAVERRYEKTFRRLEHAEKHCENITRALELRWKRFQKFKRTMKKRVANAFKRCLSHRGATGNMEIEEETMGHETLEIMVNMNRTEQDQSTKTLSGGERSFSTVSFLIALWDIVEAPFSAMDEFDVFMDMSNRTVALKLVVDACRYLQSRQAIFITPQSISSIPKGDDIRIHKLMAPQRGQQTLSFSASQA